MGPMGYFGRHDLKGQSLFRSNGETMTPEQILENWLREQGVLEEYLEARKNKGKNTYHLHSVLDYSINWDYAYNITGINFGPYNLKFREFCLDNNIHSDSLVDVFKIGKINKYLEAMSKFQ